MKDKILVIGSSGQIGGELVEGLRAMYGHDQVIASDIKENSSDGLYESLNVLDANKLFEVVKKHQVTQIYLLAALLSATAEKHPEHAWNLNMDGLFHVLNLAKEKHINQVYWPSSIAVFGPSTPRILTPQYTVMEPNTVYGISKLAGERWCEYYHQKHHVDVRSLRYPGLVGYKSAPGGGTTDYAVHIYHEALKQGSYTCFLAEPTTLPMMYMPDAIKATLQLMHTDSDKIQIRSAYNLAGMSFSPAEIALEIKKHLPDFNIEFAPDSRQLIANSWPQSIDDSAAREHWGWKPSFDLAGMTVDMLSHLRQA